MNEKFFIRVEDIEHNIFFINIYNIKYWFLNLEENIIRIYLIENKYIDCVDYDDILMDKLCKFVNFE